MFKKLRISLIYSNLVVTKSLNSNHRMHNLCANFVKI
ncbi:MAG: IS982 family transposase, partial [Muribaculaceae bacterium]|nr:IS982 family transposase [Muribaculaceae bacterium]